MDKARLDEIEAKAAAATPGPWYPQEYTRYQDGHTMKCISIRTKGQQLLRYPSIDKSVFRQENWYEYPADADIEFITGARQDIPDLIAALREAQATIDKLRGRPWGYGPTDAEGNYPDELQYYEPNEELEMAADVAAYDAAKARNGQATPWADINWAEI